jgi:hypothetical protein
VAYQTPSPSQARPIFVDDVFSALPTSIAVPEQGKMQLDQEPSIESKTPLDEFLSGPIGVNLETCLIAHDARIQALLDKKEISWGVQFELARGVTTGQWTWDAVESKIGELTGRNVDAAYRVRNVMLDLPQKITERTIWYVSLHLISQD